MSSLFGIVRRDGLSLAPDVLDAPLNALTGLKRDRVGVSVDEHAAFGQLIWHVTPGADSETLPLTRGNLTIAADVRLDNRDDLYTAFAIPPAERAHLSDAALILRAYERWGDDCPRFLIGDYAFVIWDAAAQTVYCARDHIGASPLFYYVSPEVFAFASDLRALIAFADVKTEIDEAEIAWFLLDQQVAYVNNGGTFFKATHRLPFAHWLKATREALRLEAYWVPTSQPPIRLPSLNDYADQLYEHIRRAVADRLRTDQTLGSHLSGGVDSSSVAIIAARILRERGQTLHAFSWSPSPGDDAAETEHRRIEAAARQESIAMHYSEPTLEEWIERDEDVDIALTPFVAMSMERHVQAEAEKLGVRVMLSGWGGDETASFNGRSTGAEILLRGQLIAAARYAGVGRLRQHPTHIRGVLRSFWHNIAVPLLPDRLYYPLIARQTNRSLIQPNFAAKMKPFLRPFGRELRVMPTVYANQREYYLNGHLTARIESWAIFGAQRGIRYAYPLLDRRLMEFIFRVPGDLYYRDGKPRYWFNAAMARVLPQTILWQPDVKLDYSIIRRKSPFSPEQMAIAQQRTLNDPSFQQINDWVDIAQVRRGLETIDQFKEGDEALNLAKAMDALKIWSRWKTPTSGVS